MVRGLRSQDAGCSHALIVIGGEAAPLARVAALHTGFGFVCAADSGFDALAAAGEPADLVIGDMDSLRSVEAVAALPRAKVERLPVDKDESDTEAAIAACLRAGYEDYVLAGGGGGRLDHLLAIRALFERSHPPRAWHLPNDSAFRLSPGESLVIEAEGLAYLSAFPLDSPCVEMESHGLRWPLDGLEWDRGGYSLSNELSSSTARVRAGSVALLLILHWRGE